MSVSPFTCAEQRNGLATTLPPTKSGAAVNATKFVGVSSETATCQRFRTGERASGVPQDQATWGADLKATPEYCPSLWSWSTASEKSKHERQVCQPAADFVSHSTMARASPFEQAVDFSRDLPDGEEVFELARILILGLLVFLLASGLIAAALCRPPWKSLVIRSRDVHVGTPHRGGSAFCICTRMLARPLVSCPPRTTTPGISAGGRCPCLAAGRQLGTSFACGSYAQRAPCRPLICLPCLST